jgi:predicted lipoprotein with Yx(FWY)xxD motif
MRKLLLALTLVGLSLSAGLARADPPAAPAGVHAANGALADASGLPLYTFDWDTMKGMSHCIGQCARDWPPLKAAADAQPVGDWTIIIRDDGSRQWAYKDKPIYTYANDAAGQPGMGESAGGNWKLAH